MQDSPDSIAKPPPSPGFAKAERLRRVIEWRDRRMPPANKAGTWGCFALCLMPVFLVGVTWLVTYLNHPAGLENAMAGWLWPDSPGTFGDSFGALTSLLSAVTLLLLIWQNMQQRADSTAALELAHQQLQDAREFNRDQLSVASSSLDTARTQMENQKIEAEESKKHLRLQLIEGRLDTFVNSLPFFVFFITRNEEGICRIYVQNRAEDAYGVKLMWEKEEEPFRQWGCFEKDRMQRYDDDGEKETVRVEVPLGRLTAEGHFFVSFTTKLGRVMTERVVVPAIPQHPEGYQSHSDRQSTVTNERRRLEAAIV